MIFDVLNSTGSSVVIDGVTYANGAWVDITSKVAFQGVKWTRNDIDGPAAGRSINGKNIRDRVASKGKWNVSLCAAESSGIQAILALVEPEVFYIRTDMPTGVLTTYEVYTNNIPVTFAIKKPDGSEWYSGVTIPIVEM